MNWQGRSIYAGIAQGEALVTHMGISFFGGVDPDTGIVVERGHELEGQSITGKVLVFPSGKGSTVGSYTLYRLAYNGKAPVAVINLECEPITAVGCIIADIPCVDHLPVQEFHTGQFLQVDGSSASVNLLPWPGDLMTSLPAALNGVDVHSFAYYTITQRFPNMVAQVIADTDWPQDVIDKLQSLQAEIPQSSLGLLDDAGAPDERVWNRQLRAYQHQNWLEAPWFLVETYFFRRILAATGYFQSGFGKALDPYAAQKKRAMSQVFLSLNTLLHLMDEWNLGDENQVEHLADVMRLSLWANQADLSMWSMDDDKPPQKQATDGSNAHILIDHSTAASRYLLSHLSHTARVDFVLDNVGIELANDLALVDLLLRNRLAKQIVLHVKPHPTYVSDTIRQDVLDMIDYLLSDSSLAIRSLAERLRGYLTEGQLTIESHFFWTSPLSGWEIPPDLRQNLYKSNLIISKGDANYRRWLGDRSWPFTTSLQPVLNYIPVPFLAFRVLKSNVLLGLPFGLESAMQQKDPQWLTNGSWGVIQSLGI